MKIFKGNGISSGICFGRLYFFKRKEQIIERRHIGSVERELKRYEEASEQAVACLRDLYDQALQDLGEPEAMIFRVHEMMLKDEGFIQGIKSIIKTERVNAEFAVEQTANHYISIFRNMENAYMRNRAADMRDISEKLISKLLDTDSENFSQIKEPMIIVADDLLPSEIVQLDKEGILGFALLQGSTNSHAAILARTMSVPTVVGLQGQLTEDCDGKEAVIDAFAGAVYLDPDPITLEKMQGLRAEFRRHLESMEALKGKENVTRDGRTIRINANIGSLQDVAHVLQNDAGGIGLFRSEFLYLDGNDYPTEEMQFETYKAVLSQMKGKKVIIRTMDIGADKQVDYFGLPHEENPAMGFRAIRICLQRPQLFKTQLRALFRASVYGRLGIMFPMIISVEEVRRIKEIIEEVKTELAQRSLPFSEYVELGIMIETPAAAIVSDDLAKEVDFLSIGTNDLIQYTLAVDRQNQELEKYYNLHHKAVLRLIRRVVKNGHQYGAWVGVCGELGADTAMTETFLAMGVDELSVAPPKVLEVRSKVRESDVEKVAKGILRAIGE
ncbi:MAG TPA: phosphoenolpyruvate--protein phosphotransferase [Ruminococcaceae bacterium]|nr:phosphoenolpyruvate--protein phosphotransferase [Oscillospiraceae bacterium]